LEFAFGKDYIEECKQLLISIFYKPIKHVLANPDGGWKIMLSKSDIIHCLLLFFSISF